MLFRPPHQTTICLSCLLRSSQSLHLSRTSLILRLLPIQSPLSPLAPLAYTLSNSSTSCSLLILKSLSARSISLLLSSTPSSIWFVPPFSLNTCAHLAVQTNHPYAPTPARFLKKAVDVPDLVHALASTSDLRSTTANDDALDLRLVFECLVRRIMFQYCYRELSITPYSYQQAIEYLTDRPPELAAKHKQYRAALAQLEQQAAKATVEVGKRKRMARSASSIALSMFKSKKKRLVAK
ncbi:hypothetical protein FS749_005740 [Ceratobasidium sp. UAMH 11750]|nr:hypothetical protein FS749_005740 [Ceratobasidium sp. UAMH 11750]